MATGWCQTTPSQNGDGMAGWDIQKQNACLEELKGDSWAPSSPDCNPCDFLVWGYMKSKVYQPLPLTMAVLKRKIRIEFNNIPKEMVVKAIRNMKKRGALMVASEGRQFEGR